MAKKIYIAGPMRGYKFYNFSAFDAAEARLRRLGYDVVNPAQLDRMRGIHPESFPEDWDWHKTPEGFDLKEVAMACLRHVIECDGVLTLKGWTLSRGAVTEHYFAGWVGVPSYAEQINDIGLVSLFGDPS